MPAMGEPAPAPGVGLAEVQEVGRLTVVGDGGGKRIILRGQGVGIQLVGIPVDAKASSYYGRLREPVGKAKPGRPIIVCRIDKLEAGCWFEGSQVWSRWMRG